MHTHIISYRCVRSLTFMHTSEQKERLPEINLAGR